MQSLKTFMGVMAGIVALTVVVGSAEATGLRSWDKKINDVTKRFKLRFGGAAVLDKETKLLWEQSPSSATRTWQSAIEECSVLNKGGRLGWRLPTVEELASLVDPTQTNPALPIGHPFANVQSSDYWSATSNAASPLNSARGVEFDQGIVDFTGKASLFHVWCVRGGQSHNVVS